MENELVVVNDIRKDLTLNAEDITRLSNHLALIKDVVSKNLIQGIDNDYSVVPGTKKKALLKPGAEKLMKLFGLGVVFTMTEKELDRYENFAMFTYRADIIHLKSGRVIASCEGTANSWEKKWKTRSIYENRVKVGEEATPVCDILNTLRKMAQKRAMVGGVIIATAASDYFTQDEDEIENQQAQKKEPQKVDSSKFTSKDQVDLNEYVIPKGKYEGRKMGEVDRAELSGYVSFLANNPSLNGPMKEFVDRAREFLR